MSPRMHPQWTCRLKLSIALLIAVAPASLADDLPRRGQLGVQLAPVNDETRAQFNLPAEAVGILVAGVQPDSSAAEAGFEAGDLIVQVADKPIASGPEFSDAFSRYRAGDTVTFIIRRGEETLTRTALVRQRPRETAEDYDIEYGEVRSNGHRLRTLLTKPRAGEKLPAVFFIQGLGCFSMENLGLYRPFVEEFTKAGFVTFRVDKPGCGDSEGEPCRDSDFHEVVDGYRQALAALRKLDGVDPDRIYIFGHSMGGIIGPILASETPVAGLIVYGTGFRTWLEYTFENNRRQAVLEGKPAKQVEEEIRQETLFSYELLVAKKSPVEIIAAHPELKEYIENQISGGNYLYGRHVKYFQQLYDVPLGDLWSRVDARVLALWGACDFVSSGEDHHSIAETVNVVHPGRAEYARLDGVDHWFVKTESPADSAQKSGKGEFEPKALQAMLDWLKKATNAG